MAQTAPGTRTLGLAAATALVVGNMIGSGVFLLPASLASFGGLAIAGWVASGTGAVLLALVFAWLARSRPTAGGPYAYARLAFGDFAGLVVAWGYWLSILPANAALAVAGVGYLEPFIPNVVHSPMAAAGLAVALVWVFTVINLISVRSVGQVQLVTTVLKALPLALVGIGGLWYFDASHFAVTQHGVVAVGRDLSTTATLTLFAFLGLECATIPADHVVDPIRTIPRATVLGTVIAAVIYMASTIGAMSLVPPDTLSHTTAPFAEAARQLAGRWAEGAVAIGAAISCLGGLNGWTLMAGETLLAGATDGVFPAAFARTSARGRPVAGIILSSVLVSVLVLLNASQGLVSIFTFMIVLATLGSLVPYAVCSLAPFVIRRADGRRVAATAAMATVAVLAFCYSLWTIAGAGADAILWGLVLFVAGVPVFLLRGTRVGAQS